MKIPLMLAPMAELSHRALRELIEGFGGCDEYFTEMISAGALLAGGPFERWYIDNGPCPDRLVYQLVGADSGQLAQAAALLDRLECRGIDLNMGCCAPLIRKTGAGITWMASVDRAGELVKQVRQAVKRRLSVKIRIGLTDDFGYLVQFCRRLEAEGVDLITLHPRTAREKLKRLARWDYVGALRGELHIPVAGNGDVADAKGLASRASGPCDGVMVGRAAVRQPWIFAQARGMKKEESHTEAQRHGGGGEGGEVEEREAEEVPGTALPKNFVPLCLCERFSQGVIEETGLRFLELLGRWQPVEFHVSRARRFFGFFCDNLKWGTHLNNLLNRQETLSGMEGVWRDFFREGQAETS